MFLGGVVFAVIGVFVASSESFGGEFVPAGEGERPFYVASNSQMMVGLVAVIAATAMLLAYAYQTGNIAMLVGWAYRY
jgi:hypothetical protein